MSNYSLTTGRVRAVASLLRMYVPVYASISGFSAPPSAFNGPERHFAALRRSLCHARWSWFRCRHQPATVPDPDSQGHSRVFQALPRAFHDLCELGWRCRGRSCMQSDALLGPSTKHPCTRAPVARERSLRGYLSCRAPASHSVSASAQRPFLNHQP